MQVVVAWTSTYSLSAAPAVKNVLRPTNLHAAWLRVHIMMALKSGRCVHNPPPWLAAKAISGASLSTERLVYGG